MTRLTRFEQAGAIFTDRVNSICDLEKRQFSIGGAPIIVNDGGNVLNFNGATDYVDIGKLGFTRAAGEPLTVAAWIKVDTSLVGTAVIASSRKGSSAGTLWKLERNGTQLGFQYDPTGSGGSVLGGTLEVGVWTHVCGVYDGSDVVLYINGLQIGRDTGNPSAAITVDNFSIGARIDFVGEFFEGNIRDVMVFDSALTAQEILDLTNGTTFDYDRDIISRWDMSTINPVDLAGSNDGTGTNLDETNIVNGVVGTSSAIDFNGTNESVTIPDSETLKFTSSFSVSFLFKLPTINQNSFSRIIEKEGGAQRNGWTILWKNASNQVGAEFYSAGAAINILTLSKTNWKVGNWYSLTFSFDKNNGLSGYIDGILDNSNTTVTSPGLTEEDLIIGAAMSAGNNGFNADLDTIILYSSMLTGIQVSDLNVRTKAGRLI